MLKVLEAVGTFFLAVSDDIRYKSTTFCKDVYWIAMKILSIFGTRPEAIKMAMVVNALAATLRQDAKVCVTAQHRHMLDPVLEIFAIRPDFDLNVMQDNQALVQLSQVILQSVSEVLHTFKPDRVLVHGDTTTTFFASLAAFYQHIPVAHIEAGLRSGDVYAPWPEEINRKLTTHIADLHFAPTQCAADNLKREGIKDQHIVVTGNTVIDALLFARNKIHTTPSLLQTLQQQFSFLHPDKKMLLVTGHRRENFGQGLQDICRALIKLAEDPMLQIVFPVHLNPNVQSTVRQLLNDCHNIHLLSPIDYLPFVYLMEKSYLILTDSGGIQEEAPSLGKPVLVMRDITERPEGVLAGTVKMVGTHPDTIVHEVTRLQHDPAYYQQMSCAHNPYGDGTATEKIMSRLLQ